MAGLSRAHDDEPPEFVKERVSAREVKPGWYALAVYDGQEWLILSKPAPSSRIEAAAEILRAMLEDAVLTDRALYAAAKGRKRKSEKG